LDLTLSSGWATREIPAISRIEPLRRRAQWRRPPGRRTVTIASVAQILFCYGSTPLHGRNCDAAVTTRSVPEERHSGIPVSDAPDYERKGWPSVGDLFPSVDGGYWIQDYELFCIMMKGGVVDFAKHVDKEIAAALDQRPGDVPGPTLSPYHVHLAEKRLIANKDLGRTFETVRRTLASSRLYLPAEIGKIRFVEKAEEFFFVIGTGDSFLTRLGGGIFAGETLYGPLDKTSLTAGDMGRYRCWNEEPGKECGIRLHGLPVNLKERIEVESKIGVRWAWRGFPRPVRAVLSTFDTRSISVLGVPKDLVFQLVDDSGTVLWTAQ
jgi:hypothetical protein